MQIDFAWYRRDEVLEAVAKLERRAAKLGVDFTATVAESIHHRGIFVALDFYQYNVLRGRNWLAHYTEAVTA